MYFVKSICTRNMVKILFLNILFFVLCISQTGFSQSILIKNVTLVDVEKGLLRQRQNVLIKEKQIAKIGGRAILKDSYDVVMDASGKFLIPGLIDTHIHFFQTGGLYTRPDAIDLRDKVPYEDEIRLAEELVPDHFRRYLGSGITTVMDMGGPFSNFTIRDSSAHTMNAPNILVTGPLFSPYQPKVFSQISDKPIEKVTTKEEATALFERMLPYRPDFIKIWYVAGRRLLAEDNLDLVAHIIGLAHEHNLKAVVHAPKLETAQFAVKAGADILVHSINDVIIPERFIDVLKKKEVSYIPTLIVNRNYMDTFLNELQDHPQDLAIGNPKVYGTLRDLETLPPQTLLKNIKNLRKDRASIRQRLERTKNIMAENLRNLMNRGVLVATGTDAGNIGTMHASSYIQEIQAMRESGLSNAEVLRASTLNAAKAFGMQDSLGSVTVGKLADLLLLDQNPLENLDNLQSITTVIKNGKLLNSSELLHETPEQIVQRQLNAYNARDIDAFMATYSKDIELFNFPNTRTANNWEKMKQGYGKMFESIPNLFCEVKKRMVMGNIVIDEEYVRFGEKYLNAIAIYEIEGQHILKVTFIKN